MQQMLQPLKHFFQSIDVNQPIICIIDKDKIRTFNLITSN